MSNEIFLGTRAALIKRETVYGTDSVPVEATDGVGLKNCSVTPIELGYAERELLLPYFGNFEQFPTSKLVRFQGELEIAGFGTPGPATPTPGYDAALRACALARTVNAGVSVVYTPVTDNQDAASIYYLHGKRRHRIIGARGNLGLRFKIDEIPTYTLNLLGLYTDPTDVGSLPAPTLTAYQKSLPCGPGVTTPFTIHSLGTAGLEELTIDLGTNPVLNRLINASEEVRITRRKSVGQIQIQDTLIAIKDWFASIKNATLGNLDITHGTVAGNIVQFVASNAQLSEPRLTSKDDVAHLQMALRLIPTGAGNNEFTLTVK